MNMKNYRYIVSVKALLIWLGINVVVTIIIGHFVNWTNVSDGLKIALTPFLFVFFFGKVEDKNEK